MKKFITVIIIIILTAGCIAVLPVHAEDAQVVAHWKFQNVDGYYAGNIDNDDLQFIDLSGNGNDLVTKTVGNGDQLDIFTWDEGADAGASGSASSLKINNTKLLAAAVDPYEKSETSYTGGYTSGKYLETIKGAPMNTNEFEEGISVDIIFKLSPELDNDYNRYTGIFSRQGVIEGQNEPPFSIALSEWNNDASGMLGENKTWMQYVHCDDFSKVNNEMDKIKIGADGWHHLLVTTDGFSITYYIDGEPLSTFQDIPFIDVRDPNFSWEIGVGRKSGTGHESDSKNENVPEGMIRRLFAGSISEIRVMDGPIELSDSLYAKSVSYDTVPGPATAKDPGEVTTGDETPAEIPTDESGALIITDMTDPEVVSKIVNGHNCTVMFDESNLCAKVTVTGDDPYFTLPMGRDIRFDGDKYNTIVITYKTDVEDVTGEIFFSTKNSANLADNHIMYFMEAAEDFSELEIDMRDDDNGNWTGEIGSIRIDPSITLEEQVFYIKSVKVKEGEEIVETEPDTTEKAPDTTADTDKATETVDTTDKTTDKAPETTGGGNASQGGGPNVGLIIGIAAGAVALVCVIIFIILKAKKKK